jgi:hypothetical protein
MINNKFGGLQPSCYILLFGLNLTNTHIWKNTYFASLFFMKPLSRYITHTAAAFTTLSTMFHQSRQPSCHINFL